VAVKLQDGLGLYTQLPVYSCPTVGVKFNIQLP